MRKRYWTIAGRSYDLSVLSSEEQEFLGEMFELFSLQPRMTHFMNAWMSRGLETIWKTKDYEGSPVYRICQDLQARLGIAQKKLSPPDYRDQIVALIEELFPSRYRFCKEIGKEIGIDESHLSRVLAGKKELAQGTYQDFLDALGLKEGPPVLRRQLSDYLELDNPEVELAALGRQVKWLERRKKDLAESDPNTTLATTAGSSASVRPVYLPKEIVALDSVEAVTKAIQRTLTEMQQLGERISEQAKARIPVLASQLRLSEAEPRHASATAASAIHVGEVAPALSSASLRTEPQPDRLKRLDDEATRVSEQIRWFWEVSKPGNERIVSEISRELSLGLQSQNMEYAVLSYRNDKVAVLPVYSALASELGNECPGISRALAFNPSVTILDISHLKKGVEDHIRRLAEELGVQFLRWAEYKRFQHSQENVASTPMMQQWIENHLAIRYVLEPRLLDSHLFFRIVSSSELRTAGLLLSLMHASVLERGVMDFLVLDQNQEPVSDPKQLSILLQPEFYKRFGVSQAYLLENWSEFYSLGLSQGAGTLVMPGLKKERRRDRPKERVEDFVREVLGSDPKIEGSIALPQMDDLLFLRRKAA